MESGAIPREESQSTGAWGMGLPVDERPRRVTPVHQTHLVSCTSYSQFTHNTQYFLRKN